MGSSVNGSEPGQFVERSGQQRAVLLLPWMSQRFSFEDMAAVPVSISQQQGHLQLRAWFSDGVNGFAALDPA